VLVVLAVAHLFGFYNPTHLADFLDVPHQKFVSDHRGSNSQAIDFKV
jgi:hypothetical protein